MDNQNYIEWIEQYLDGTLDEVQKNAFEKQLQDDIELQKYLQLRKALHSNWAKAKEYQQVKSEITQHFKKERKVKTTNIRYLSAAVITLLIGLTIIFRNNIFSPEDEFAQCETSNVMQGTYVPFEHNASAMLYNDTLFKISDTIRITVPAMSDKSVLHVFNVNNDAIVYSDSIKNGMNEVKIAPGVLEVGRYHWVSLPDEYKGNIEIQK